MLRCCLKTGLVPRPWGTRHQCNAEVYPECRKSVCSWPIRHQSSATSLDCICGAVCGGTGCLPQQQPRGFSPLLPIHQAATHLLPASAQFLRSGLILRQLSHVGPTRWQPSSSLDLLQPRRHPSRPGIRLALAQILHVVPGGGLDVLHPRSVAVLLLVRQVPLEEELRGSTASPHNITKAFKNAWCMRIGAKQSVTPPLLLQWSFSIRSWTASVPASEARQHICSSPVPAGRITSRQATLLRRCLEVMSRTRQPNVHNRLTQNNMMCKL